MSYELHIFYSIGILATVVLLLQMCLMLVGADHDMHVGDADMSGAGEHSSGLHLLSIRTIVSFFVGFGWMGVVALKRQMSLPATIAMAVLVGGVFMFLVFYLMKSLHSLRSSGSLDYRNAIGQTGSVYLTIPANHAGPGQIEVMIQGRLSVVHAYTKSGQPLANSSKVRVVGLIDQQTLLVEPLSI